MFYGEPGCGKTSTIKAIANHTQRHIVSVPLNKRLYVLEDIDAADLKDTVGERSMKDDNENEKKDNDDSGRESPSLDMNMNLFGILKNSSGWDKKFGAQKLTLANLLEVLDGVMEMEGRMLIITTNY